MTETLTPLIWVAIAVPLLLLLQRWIHTHLHGISLLLTGKADRAIIIYALILLPGVILHELSHWIVATLLGVRTGSFSLLPRRQKDGTVTLGYVEYYKGRTLGPIRESLVGGAPLIAGTAVIFLISFHVFSITDLAAAVQTGEIDNLTTALSDLFATPDILVWLYLLFAISNAMMPSPSDRRAWPAFLALMGGAAIILYLLGVADVVIAQLAGPVAVVFGYLGTALSMAIGVDLAFVLLIVALESIIGRIRGVAVVYDGAGPASDSQK